MKIKVRALHHVVVDNHVKEPGVIFWIEESHFHDQIMAKVIDPVEVIKPVPRRNFIQWLIKKVIDYADF